MHTSNFFYCRGLLFGFVMIFLQINTSKAATTDSLNIKNFGAKGDGVSNDYPAFLAAVKKINNKSGHCKLIFPPGHYIIDAVNTVNQKFQDLEFNNCTDISIIGFNALIDLKANYNQAADYITSTKKTVTRSKTYSIVPFSFNNCNNVILSGFEVNGNADKITRDAKVVETPSNLVKIWETENLQMSNMYIHHGTTDGIYIGGSKKFSKNIHVISVTSQSNARQGMSVVNLRDAIFEKCKFINTGYFIGNYGHHNPGAGVDIEPIRKNINGVKTGNIKFINCKFENNIGGQIRNGQGNAVDSIFFIGDTIIANSSGSKYQLVLGCGYSEINNCYIDVGNGFLYTTSMRATDKQSTLITNSKIYVANGSIISTNAAAQIATVQIINNKIFCKPQKNNAASWFDLPLSNVKFAGNEVYLPAYYFSSSQNEIYISKQKIKSFNTVKALK